MKLVALPCIHNNRPEGYVDLGSRGTGGKRRRIYWQTKEETIQAAADKIRELDSYGQESESATH